MEYIVNGLKSNISLQTSIHLATKFVPLLSTEHLFEKQHYDKNGKLVTERQLGLPIGFLAGIEYEFRSPLNISIDWRPMVNVFNFNQFDYSSTLLNLALCLRYRF